MCAYRWHYDTRALSDPARLVPALTNKNMHTCERKKLKCTRSPHIFAVLNYFFLDIFISVLDVHYWTANKKFLMLMICGFIQ